ncbi:hypothetical protein [Paenibacillus sinopodophylli]|nr:hypothetical protein [Paenibacillus sinopodophylli]
MNKQAGWKAAESRPVIQEMPSLLAASFECLAEALLLQSSL